MNRGDGGDRESVDLMGAPGGSGGKRRRWEQKSWLLIPIFSSR